MGEHLEDPRLAGVPLVAGDHFSVAHITALVTINFAARRSPFNPEGKPSADRWYEEVSAPSSWRESVRSLSQLDY